MNEIEEKLKAYEELKHTLKFPILILIKDKDVRYLIISDNYENFIEIINQIENTSKCKNKILTYEINRFSFNTLIGGFKEL